MLGDNDIKQAIESGNLVLEPFSADCLQAASYDFRVGSEAFTSSAKEKVDLKAKGLVTLEPGDFAIVSTMERVTCSPRVAGTIGLSSDLARRGLQVLAGPQIDPGFSGVLCVRLVNLAPKKISLPYGKPFLTVQFFLLNQPVSRPYTGRRKGQTGISPDDMRDLAEVEGMTMGEIIKTLSSVARDVSTLQGSVSRLTWMLPLIVGLGIAVIGVITAIK